MATRIEKNTAQFRLNQLQGKLDNLFQHQELGKGGRVAQKYFEGGRVRKTRAADKFFEGGRLRTSRAIPKYPDGGDILSSLANVLPTSPLAGQSIGGGIDTSNLAGGIGNTLASTGNLSGYTPQVSRGNRAFRVKARDFAQNVGPALGNAAFGLGAFAPIGYNLAQGLRPADRLDYQDYRNPEYARSAGLYSEAANIMANRRYDPGSEIENIQRQGAVQKQGLKQLPTSTGGYITV